MNFFNEYALLVAVATPVVAIVSIMVTLFLAGERGTLLLPGFGGYPSIERVKKSGDVVAMPVAERAASVASNDAMEREAA